MLESLSPQGFQAMPGERAIITIADFFMGRDKSHANELTPEIRRNAAETVKRVNQLLVASGIKSSVNSGWRPEGVNASTPGAAKKSKHMLGLACDLSDSDGKLDRWCMANQHRLATIGLWLEHPSATKNANRFGEGWCHVQTVPPKSGNRVFYP